MKSRIFIGLIFLFAACSDDEITPQQQLLRDIAKIDKYLASQEITDVIEDASGVRIVIHTLGDLGLPPNVGNEMVVKYTGKYLSNGEEFESGTVEGKLTDWIGGWQIALPMLPEGTIATLYIPSGWAYGTRGKGSIPGNANLIFDIELESVTPTNTQASKLASDITAIDQYLLINEISATADDSGIRYVTTLEGTGVSPTLYSQVKFSIKGKTLADNTEFLNVVAMPSEDFSSRVANYLQGIMVGLQLMKEGGKATFYVPSGLAYGTQSFPNLPANSNVIFEVQLVDVIE